MHMTSNPQKFLMMPVRRYGEAIQELPSEWSALCWAHRVAQIAPVLSLRGLPSRVVRLGWENPDDSQNCVCVCVCVSAHALSLV